MSLNLTFSYKLLWNLDFRQSVPSIVFILSYGWTFPGLNASAYKWNSCHYGMTTYTWSSLLCKTQCIITHTIDTRKDIKVHVICTDHTKSITKNPFTAMLNFLISQAYLLWCTITWYLEEWTNDIYKIVKGTWIFSKMLQLSHLH